MSLIKYTRYDLYNLAGAIIRDYGNYPIPTHEEEIQIMRRYKKGGAGGQRAFDEMVTRNLRLVISIAKKYSDTGATFEDLIQEGVFGLIEAVKKYDYHRGRFSTMATWWIKQRIRRAVHKNDIIRIPVHVQDLLYKIRSTISTLSYEKGRYPTIDELSICLNLTPDAIKATLSCLKIQPFSLGIPVGDGSDDPDKDSLSNILEDPHATGPDEKAEEASVKDYIREIMFRYLTTREYDILDLRYGGEQTLDEISKKYNLTRERIRQIEKKALTKMKKKLNLACIE